jgi:hypothetical protein
MSDVEKKRYRIRNKNNKITYYQDLQDLNYAVEDKLESVPIR